MGAVGWFPEPGGAGPQKKSWAGRRRREVHRTTAVEMGRFHATPRREDGRPPPPETEQERQRIRAGRRRLVVSGGVAPPGSCRRGPPEELAYSEGHVFGTTINGP